MRKLRSKLGIFKSDASREGTVDEKEVLKRDVAQVELCKLLKITHIKFGNFSGDLACMQVAARCMCEGKSCCPRVKFDCFSNLANSSCY